MIIDFIFAAELLIFISYCILSIIVFDIFIKNFQQFNNTRIIALVILTAMFLMLCALTHLSYLWGGYGLKTLTFLCSFVSIMAAIVTVNLRNYIDDAITKRFRTAGIIKDETILDLMSDYGVNIDVKNNVAVKATVNGTRVLHPGRIQFTDGMDIGSVITVNDCKYKIIHKLHTHSSDLEVQTQEYILFGIDVTSQINMQDSIKANNVKRLALCLTTAHEIRTPLTFMSFLRDYVYKNTKVELSEDIVNEFSYNLEMLSLIATQMMDAGRILGGYELIPTYTNVNIRELFKKIEVFSKYLHSDFIKSEFNVDENVPITFVTDSEWLWQILINFVTNAFKYTSSGYVKLFCVCDSMGEIVIRVIDSGIGLSIKDMSRVFEMFVDIQTHSKGIGLFTINEKVKILGGKCNVYKNPDYTKGTIFEAILPKNSKVPVVKMYQLPEDLKKSILVVDDTITVISIMKRYLKNYNVDIAMNGEEALEKMMSKEYGIVFMDLLMPVMGGIEATEIFRTKEKSLNRVRKQRIVMMSATEIERPDIFTEKFPKPLKWNRLKELIQQN